MAEQKESSVLFSLKELMSLEEDRIRQEEDKRQREVRAQEDARLEAERRAREAEESRIRAEEERRRMEEQRSREETARLDAMKHAEVERARLDAENAARMEAMKHQQDHERQLEAIREGQGKKKAIYGVFGIAGVLVLAIVLGGLYLKSSNEKAAQEKARQSQELGERDRQIASIKAELDKKNEAVSDLEKAVSSAKTNEERSAKQALLEKARREQQDTAKQLRGGPVAQPGQPTTRPSKPCNCPPGDPLCTCL